MARKLKNILGEVSFFRLTRFFIILFILFFPFQIRSLIFSDNFYLTGNFNTYGSFFIFAADIFLMLSLVGWGLAYLTGEIDWKLDWGDRGLSILSAIFILLLVVNIFIFPGAFAIFFVFRLIILYFFYLLLSNGILAREKIIRYFTFAMVFQVLIAIGQYVSQGSIGLLFLGEPVIGPTVLGAAKVNLPSGLFIRSYGTFLHPNIFAAALFAAILLSLYVYRKRIYMFLVFAPMFSAGSVFSFYRSMMFALILSFFLIISLAERKELLKQILYVTAVFVFFIVVFDLQNIFWQRYIIGDDGGAVAERLNYLSVSRKVILDNPFGVGIGQFTNEMQSFSETKLEPWEAQPVHNLFLLVAAEAGLAAALILGLVFFYIFFRTIYLMRELKRDMNEKIYAMVIAAMTTGIVTLAIFDHYFYTSYQGLVMLFLYFYLAGDLLKKFEWPRKKS